MVLSNGAFYLTIYNIFVFLYLSQGSYLISYYYQSLLILFYYFKKKNTKTVGMLKDMKNRERCGVSLGN